MPRALVLCLVLMGCNGEKKEIGTNTAAKTFCQNGATYEVPKWDETGKLGFLIEGSTC